VTTALGEERTRAAFYLANSDGTELNHVVGMSAEYAEAVKGFKIGPESLASGLATHQREPVITLDVMEDSRWSEWRWMAAKFGYRGCWSFPLHSIAGKFVGTLAVYSREPRSAEERDLELARLMTQTAAIIVARHWDSENRLRAEIALQRSEARSWALLSGMADAFWETDREGLVVDDSQSWRAKSGETLDEWMRHGWVNSVHPEDRESANRQWHDAVSSHQKLEAVFRLRNVDGSYRWGKLCLAPLLNEEGTVEKWIGMRIDLEQVYGGLPQNH
jgi:PAS domain S-box-containing protein